MPRPARILESWAELQCPSCHDWFRREAFARHFAGTHDVKVPEPEATRRVLLRDRILELVRAGNYPEVAAGIAGISRATYYSWSQRASEWADAPLDEVPAEERLYVEFLDAVRGAQDVAEGRMLAVVVAGAASNPLEARWWLERVRPDRYSRRETVRIGGADGGPVRVDREIHEPDFIAEVTEKLLEAGILGPRGESTPEPDEEHNGTGPTNGVGPH